MQSATTRVRLSSEQRRKVIIDAASEVFGERGYHGASIEEIARRSGVSVPVIYDHFAGKRALFEHLLERHYEELRAIWIEHPRSESAEHWFAAAVDAWFAYVEHHPFAGRLLFHDTTGDPTIEAAHRAIQLHSRASLLPLTAAAFPQLDGPYAVELAWEAFRATLQGLAIWWYEHPGVPRSTIVAGAMQSVWIGIERGVAGVAWTPRDTLD